jgi:hypothetical protein
VLREVVEERHAIRFLKTGLPRLNGIDQVFKGTLPPICDKQGHPRRAWCAGLERFTQSGQGKPLLWSLGENA